SSHLQSVPPQLQNLHHLPLWRLSYGCCKKLSHRTRRHGHVDRKVDDSFGALEETVSHNVSISEQILGAMTLGKLDPQRQLSMSPEEFLEDLRRSSAPDTQNVDVELMKEDIARAGEADFEKAFLHFFEEPATVGNLLAMQEMIAAPDIYRKLTSLSLSSPDGEETSTQSSGLSESEGTTRAEAEESIGLSDLAPDIAGSLEELQGSYDGLLSDEAALVDRAYDNPGITSSEALRLSRIGAQISLLSSFARKNYYELPVRTEAGTVLMNLTLRRGSDNKGLIGIRFRSGLPVDMTMRAGENTVDGVLTCGDRSLEGPLKEALTEVTDSLKGSGYEEVRLFFAGTGTDERSYLERIGQGSGSETENAEKLFGIAKTVTRALATRL
ncbi:MAG: hypothetical protein ILP10_06250, partial [Lachnospiraceae bacterium]|nr:hypothetical protein [Lachnospiraceae bacterium]